MSELKPGFSDWTCIIGDDDTMFDLVVSSIDLVAMKLLVLWGNLIQFARMRNKKMLLSLQGLEEPTLIP